MVLPHNTAGYVHQPATRSSSLRSATSKSTRDLRTRSLSPVVSCMSFTNGTMRASSCSGCQMSHTNSSSTLSCTSVMISAACKMTSCCAFSPVISRSSQARLEAAWMRTGRSGVDFFATLSTLLQLLVVREVFGLFWHLLHYFGRLRRFLWRQHDLRILFAAPVQHQSTSDDLRQLAFGRLLERRPELRRLELRLPRNLQLYQLVPLERDLERAQHTRRQSLVAHLHDRLELVGKRA